VISAAAGRRRRLIRLVAGAGFALMSVVSVVLSLGAPGLGWVLATVTMVAVSLCSHLVGQRWLWICLGVTLVHLITLGPLGGSAGSSFGGDWVFGTVFTAMPLVVGVVALVVTYLRSRK
jgi:hypothetical protein